jgi:hypothetical protein
MLPPVRAHVRTVLPRLARSVAAGRSHGEPWRCVVDEPLRAPVALGGRFALVAGSRTVVVMVHGLGGSWESPYQVAVARACEAAGASTLRLGLRGSDGEAGDFYHAGLTSDIAAALASPELAGFERVALLGFSLGGHVTLRYATEEGDPRLVAVGAVCAPLDLLPAQRDFDRPSGWPYRLYILGRLKQLYAAIASHGPVPTPVEVVRRARTLREWDRLTVVPRFGFASPEDYYARASVGPHLGRLAVPALLVACPRDPMVPASAISTAAAGASGALDLRWVRGGGHVAFPSDLDLGMPGPRGLAGQLAGWLLASPA